ncbi:MAG: DNA-binding protein [Euryarchaeota archaeon]|nr:DNA-binding protein [Euryarchaeota archaeon]
MSVEDYYQYVADLMTLRRFKDEIAIRREKYGGLLDDDAIAYLIVDELDRNPGNKMRIAELYDGINATVEGVIINIGEIENRKNHRILRVTIKDNSGICQFVLWNDEIDDALKNLQVGKKIKIINGYVRENQYGLQISLGKWGLLVFT